jgi:hypothetical protein
MNRHEVSFPSFSGHTDPKRNKIKELTTQERNQTAYHTQGTSVKEFASVEVMSFSLKEALARKQTFFWHTEHTMSFRFSHL